MHILADAQRHGHMQVDAIVIEPHIVDALAQPLGQGPGAVGVGLRHQDEEFLATPAGQAILLAQELARLESAARDQSLPLELPHAAESVH